MAMATSRSQPAMASRSDALRTFIAYALIGFTNILLPLITFACAYLIIPFPRIAVVFIEGLPALAAKILFPHLIRYVPYWARPLILASCWALCGVVTWATPPNVEPPVRVLIVMLAAATAAATDISMLGMLRFYGNAGLAGWGVGTGVGYVAAAAMPYYVTEHLGRFLRSSNDYPTYLIPLALVAYYLILPRSLRNNAENLQGSGKPLDEDMEDEAGAGLLVQDPPQPPRTFLLQVEHNFALLSGLVKPYMAPLYTATSTLAIFFPGLVRAQPESSSFATFMNYATAYGIAIHVGNLLGRSTIMIKRLDKFRHIELPRKIVISVVMLNTGFLFFSNATLLLWLAGFIGFLSGATYIHTMGDALESIPRGHDDQDYEFSLGAIGVGDAAGALGGSFLGALLAPLFCGLNPEDGTRWCHFPT